VLVCGLDPVVEPIHLRVCMGASQCASSCPCVKGTQEGGDGEPCQATVQAFVRGETPEDLKDPAELPQRTLSIGSVSVCTGPSVPGDVDDVQDRSRTPRTSRISRQSSCGSLYSEALRSRCSITPSCQSISSRSRNTWKGSVDLATSCHFPIYTLPMENFQALEVMMTHEELREDLIQPEDDEVVHFISHEWLGFKHADPDGVQLRTMQKVFSTIAGGNVKSLFTEVDFESFSKGVSAGTGKAVRAFESGMKPRGEFSESDVAEHISGGSVWLDYHSVPQEGHKTTFMSAVQSIPHYVERCDYFWICAPRAKHSDLHAVRDFSSWRQRGWCRFEEVVNLLSRALKMPLIVTSPTKVGTYGFLDAIQMFFGRPERSVANGSFTCCRFNHKVPQADGTFIDIPCDKSALGNILVLLYMSLVKAQDAQNQLKRNMLCLAAPGIFDGYDEELDWVCPPRTLGTSAILKKYGFESPEERDGVRFPALMWVLSHGAMDAARDIVQQRPEALYERSVHNMSVMVRCMIMPPQLFKEFLYMHDGLRTREELNYATQNGYTPADRGAKYGFHENLRTILELKASTNNRRKDNGCTPLLSAAQEGYDKCVEVLLEFRADVRAVDNEQRGMLHLAGESLSTLGNSEEGCRLRVVQLALQARADPSARDSRGNTPLQACLTAGNDDIAALIQTAIRTL